jgi:hypothetical protein
VAESIIWFRLHPCIYAKDTPVLTSLPPSLPPSLRRALDDPANESFLRDMARGVVPRELEVGVPPGQAVHVNLKVRPPSLPPSFPPSLPPSHPIGRIPGPSNWHLSPLPHAL